MTSHLLLELFSLLFLFTHGATVLVYDFRRVIGLDGSDWCALFAVCK